MSRSLKFLFVALAFVAALVAAVVDKPNLDLRVDDTKMTQASIATAPTAAPTPKALQKIKRSRTKYRDLNAKEAAKAVATTHHDLLHKPKYPTPMLGAGKRVKKYTSTTSALVDVPGEKADAVMESVGNPIATSEGKKFKGIDTDLRATDDGYVSGNALVESTLPSQSDAPIVSQFADPGKSVSVSVAGDSVEAVKVDPKKLFFANTATDTDQVTETTPTGVEVSWAVRSNAAPETFEMTFASRPGVELALGDDGTVQLISGGAPVGSVAPATAFDAAGKPVPVSYSTDGSKLELKVEHRNSTVLYPIAVDPVVGYYPGTAFREEDAGGALFSGWRESANPANAVAFQGPYTQPWSWTITKNPGGTVGSGWWAFAAPNNASIFRAEFGGVKHSPKFTTLRTGIYSTSTGWGGSGWGGWAGPGCTEVSYGNIPGCQANGSPLTSTTAITSPISTVSCVFVGCGIAGSSNSPQSIKNIAAFQLTANQTFTTNSASATMLGGYVYESDTDNPAITMWPGTATSGPQLSEAGEWQKNRPAGTFNVYETDPGMGLGRSGEWGHYAALIVRANGTQVRSNGNGDDGPNYCQGGSILRCLTEWTSSYSPGEGYRNMQIEARDIVGHLTAKNFPLRVDNAGPQITIGGRLGAFVKPGLGAADSARTISKDAPFSLTATDGRKKNADGTDSDGSARRSGTKWLKASITKSNTANEGDSGVAVPGYASLFDSTTGTQNDCKGLATSDDSCTITGSLTFPTTAIRSAAGAGIYYLHVDAEDGAGNPTSVTYKIGVGSGDVTSVNEGFTTSKYVPLQATKSVGSPSLARFQYRFEYPGAVGWTTWADVPESALKFESTGGPVSNPGCPGCVTIDSNGVTQRLVMDAVALDPRFKGGRLNVRAVFDPASSTPLAARATEDVAGELDQGGDTAGDTEATLGVGQVNLASGNLTVGGTDASLDAYGEPLVVARTYGSRYASSTDEYATARTVGPLGAGWKLSLPDGNGGDYSSLTDYADTSRQVEDRFSMVGLNASDGSQIGFEVDYATSSATEDSYKPDLGYEHLQLKRFKQVGDQTRTDYFRLTDKESGTVMNFSTRNPANDGTYDLTKTYPAVTGDSYKTMSYSYGTPTDGAGNPVSGGAGKSWVKSMTAATAAAPSEQQYKCSAVDSSSPTEVAKARGCQTLNFIYASVGTGSTLPRLDRIDLRSWSVDAAAIVTTTVARYGYDGSGRLIQTYDPRSSVSSLITTYSYDANNLLSSVVMPGTAATTMTYVPTSTSGDPTPGRISTVSRPKPDLSGPATQNVVYNVPLGGTNGAPLMTSASVSANWDQKTPPLRATAVYPANQSPSGSNFDVATISYMDAMGREVNHVTPGGAAGPRVSATEYDKYSNSVRTITPGNITRILAKPAAERVAASHLLDAQNIYSPELADGSTRLIETLGPERDTKLDSGGSTFRAREHKRITYDEGMNPTEPGTVFSLPTTEVQSVLRTSNAIDYDERTTKHAYYTSGYAKPEDSPYVKYRQPSETIKGFGAANLKYQTVLNAQGQAIQARQPKAAVTPYSEAVNAHAGNTRTVYYEANSSDTDCDGQPEWDGLVCKELPASQPSGSLPAIPTKYYAAYNLLREPLTLQEQTPGGSVLRTTTWTYDNSGRNISESITGSTGQATKKIFHNFSTSNGLETSTETRNGDGSTSQLITRMYNSLGQLTFYTDANGTTSKSTYDSNGRILSADDGIGVTSYNYDSTTGDLTSQSDTKAGVIAAVYDQDGRVISEAEPNGYAKTMGYDEAGNLTSKSYARTTGCTSGCVLYSDAATYGAQGRVSTETGTTAQHAYTYDSVGRLSSDVLGNWGACTANTYGYDDNSNRVSEDKSIAGFGGACNPVSGTPRGHDFDEADRIKDGGYAYDSLGRTTSVPAVDAGGSPISATYYTNDLAHSITQSGTTSTLNRDPSGRVSQRVMTGSVNHDLKYTFSDDSDSPSWYRQDNSFLQRFITGPDGESDVLHAESGATTWVLTTLNNIRGDQISVSEQGNFYDDTSVDAFGSPFNAVPDLFHYGFLGGKNRESITANGVINMGARLYVPQTGRFLQTDPVDGGSATNYDYCNQDPVNCTDLGGTTSPQADPKKGRYKMTTWMTKKQARRMIAKLREKAEVTRRAASLQQFYQDAMFGTVGLFVKNPYAAAGLGAAGVALALVGYQNGQADKWDALADKIENKLTYDKNRGVRLVSKRHSTGHPVEYSVAGVTKITKCGTEYRDYKGNPNFRPVSCKG